jgi:hypothetical protein
MARMPVANSYETIAAPHKVNLISVLPLSAGCLPGDQDLCWDATRYTEDTHLGPASHDHDPTARQRQIVSPAPITPA